MAKLIFCFPLILVLTLCLSLPAFSQDQDINEDEKRIDREVSYRSPIRYIIVYNYTFNFVVDERRIDVLIDPKKFNKHSLTEIFTFIKNKYPEPQNLEITVHSSLETIETPEERELMRDSQDTRFAKVLFDHKRAVFHRFSSGREVFAYTVSLHPYLERTVIINEGSES